MRIHLLTAVCLTFTHLSSGTAVATVRDCDGFPSDFDGDGRADLAVASPYESVKGHARAGAVTVHYGSARKVLLSQAGPGVPGEPENGDSFGSALAVGDFDGDSCADLAVGISEEFAGEPRPGADGEGAVQLFHGSPTGLRPGRQLRMDKRGSDRFGASLAAGDLDGDGEDELVVGAPTLAGGGGVVVHGYKGRKPHKITQGTGWVGQNARVTDRFGATLATGDFNGDGRDELVVGAPADSIRVEGQGSVTVIDARRGHAALYTQDSPWIKGVAEKWDGFGASLATGDFDADGRDDLAIGVPGEGLTANQRAMDYGDGMVHVVYGARSGLRTARSEAWTQRVLQGTPRYYDRFGTALATGDFNGDGDDELAIGVPGENAVAVLAGTRAGGLTRTGNLLVKGSGRDFGAALAALPGGGGRYRQLGAGGPVFALVVGAPGKGVVTLVPGEHRPGAHPGLRAGQARRLSSGPGLYGYAFG